jgi:GTP-binding protein
MIPGTFFASVGNLSELPDDTRPQVAMVGRSNVGKSSMINHLANQKQLARVSGEPGRTQTVNLYDFGGKFFLVDLPGYGFAKTAKSIRENFPTMIREYLSTSEQLRMVYLIIDARIPQSPLDLDMMEWLMEQYIPFTIVLNKMDKVTKNEAFALHQKLETQFPGIKRIEHSIRDGKSQKAMWGAIESAVRTPQRSALPAFLQPTTLGD